MSKLYDPEDFVPAFGQLKPLDRAILLREYLDSIDAEAERVKADYTKACAEAREAGDTEARGWRLQTRYAEGRSTRPDVELLRTARPDLYERLEAEQLKSWRPKLTKTDLDWLLPDRDERKAVSDAIMVEHPVETQYILIKTKEAGE